MKPAKFAWLFILCALFALLAISDTQAYRRGRPAGSKIVPCDVRAYVAGRAQGDFNVRSGPGQTYKTIGHLPNQEVEGISVHITGARGGWVRIDRAVEEGGERERTLFQGEGWVYAPILGVSGMAITNGGTLLYQQATEKSRVITRVPGGDDGPIVLGCRGQWMYIKYKKRRGWAAPNTLCANPLTTCV